MPDANRLNFPWLFDIDIVDIRVLRDPMQSAQAIEHGGGSQSSV